MSKFFKWRKQKPDETASQETVEENATVSDTAASDTPEADSLPVDTAIPETEVAKVEESSAATSDSTAVAEETTQSLQASQDEVAADAKEQDAAADEQEKPKFYERLKAGLAKTKSSIGSGFANLFLGKKIDEDLFEELETQLLTADLGIETTTAIIDSLTEKADRGDLKDAQALYPLLQEHMAGLLKDVEQPIDFTASDGPFVVLMVGVNGVGKTTTIGKMAKQLQAQGKKVMLAAGDTFRAAAVEQLQVWGERNDIPVIAQQTGADSASVLFDALQSAKARNVDVLIADTAGRLQNKDHLMTELQKVVRVMKKLDPNAPHEVMLTLDAGTGQNAISQAKLFNEAVGLTGITLTKLDGTAKGGVIFAIADKLAIPIRYIGVGEGIDDLRTFDSNEFVSALFE